MDNLTVRALIYNTLTPFILWNVGVDSILIDGCFGRTIPKATCDEVHILIGLLLRFSTGSLLKSGRDRLEASRRTLYAAPEIDGLALLASLTATLLHYSPRCPCHRQSRKCLADRPHQVYWHQGSNNYQVYCWSRSFRE